MVITCEAGGLYGESTCISFALWFGVITVTMSLAASFYGSHAGRPNASTLSDARSNEYRSGDFTTDAANTQDGRTIFSSDIRNAFIRHQQELIPGVMEEIKASITEPLNSLQGQVTRRTGENERRKR